MLYSIVTCTARREPKFDWLADSLCKQIDPVDFEWVVIDALLWGNEQQANERRAQLRDAVRGRIDYVIHRPPKPCRWQGPARYTKSDYFALNNARNTALIIATGKHIILLDDCTVTHPRWLSRHAQWAEKGFGVAGTYCTYQTASVENGKIIHGTVGPFGWDYRRKRIQTPSTEIPVGWAYGLNCSYPLEAALRVGALDETYDGQSGSDDCDFSVRISRGGLQFIFDPLCIVYQILNTHNEVFGHMGWDKSQSSRPNKELKLRTDGRLHFANESLIERLLWDEPDRIKPLADWIDIPAIREHYRATGQYPAYDLGPPNDWRDGQWLSQME